MNIDYGKLLPLSEATYYVLVALDTPLHGYAVMQKVDSISEGSVSIGAGTLYGVLTALEKQGLIVKEREEERRKIYALTAAGRAVVQEQVRRLALMVKNGAHIGAPSLKGTAA